MSNKNYAKIISFDEQENIEKDSEENKLNIVKTYEILDEKFNLIIKKIKERKRNIKR